MALTLPPPPLWARLLIQILWLPIVATLTALSVPLFVLGVLLWPIDRKLRVVRLLALIVVFLWLDAGLVTGCFYIWLRHARRRDHASSQAWREEHGCSSTPSRIMEHAQRWIGLRVELEETIDFGRTDRCSSSPDTPVGDSVVLAFMLAVFGNRLPRVVLKDLLRWAPGVGALLYRMRSYFVPSIRRRRRSDQARAGPRRIARADGCAAAVPRGTELDPASVAGPDRTVAGHR